MSKAGTYTTVEIGRMLGVSYITVNNRIRAGLRSRSLLRTRPHIINYWVEGTGRINESTQEKGWRK